MESKHKEEKQMQEIKDKNIWDVVEKEKEDTSGKKYDHSDEMHYYAVLKHNNRKYFRYTIK